MTDSFAALEINLGHQFTSRKLLEQAVTHKSYAHEQHCEHNERLEFLGDAILQCMISQLLFDAYPEMSEGSLSKFRAALVSEEGLMRIAHRIDIGSHLRLGKGEESSGGRQKRSILADSVEALIAACYLDSREDQGLTASRQLVHKLFSPEIKTEESRFETIDYKTALQEKVQQSKLGEITYLVIEERGPDHEKEFYIALQIAGQEYGCAWGSSKKRAEQNAAIKGLEKLKETE